MIMVTKKGIEKDEELPQKVDKGVFPGLQGGPHDHQTAAIAIALKEADTDSFRAYGKQIVTNAIALAKSLKKNGLKLVADGTENHLILVDLVPLFGSGGGVFGSDAMELAGMTANKNTIPKDPGSPFYPSGIRLGTPAITTRGMKEKEMEKVGEFIARSIKEVNMYRLPSEIKERPAYLKKFKADIAGNTNLKQLREEVREFCKGFPVPAEAR
jgi:glycine hydroxymethyltransferase